jgi:hypothetical protein
MDECHIIEVEEVAAGKLTPLLLQISFAPGVVEGWEGFSRQL